MKQSLVCLFLVLAAGHAWSVPLPEAAKIDAILAKAWQKQGLKPNAPAPDEALVRRLYS